MHPNSPFYLFDPSSIGWLHRRHEKGELILPEDVVRLAEADSRNFEDPVFQGYLLAALKGELRRRRGRRPHGAGFELRLRVATEWLSVRAAEIRAERKRDGYHSHRPDVDPGEEAANEIGNDLFLPRGRSLLNAISSLKQRDKNMKSEHASA